MSDNQVTIQITVPQRDDAPTISRKVAGRKRLKPGDGRSKRATGRTAQLNIKVRPEWKAELSTAAAARGLLMVELIEQMFSDWRARQ